MTCSPRWTRGLLAMAAIVSAVALAGCNTDGATDLSGRALKPLSKDMQAEIERKNMPADSPILIRIFKEEAELEVWKKDANGRFAHLKTYPICRWSGELGPKIKEGDRQAPEGFYQITPGLMNPHSNYYLAFNLGFPNAYDKANDRTGAFLMVHGDCSSRGCYAMTDEQIQEIFALGRDSFQGGQQSFQVQAFPFRMTPMNMAKHRNSPNMAFWRMIKQGSDYFEVTRQEPKVDVCEKRYVFDAESPDGRPLNFSPRTRCPAYQVNPEVAAAVKQKQENDDRQFAELVARGTATVAVHTGTDGGMNPIFLAKLKPKGLLDGVFTETKVVGAQPGAIGDNVNPPRPAGDQSDIATASTPPSASVRAAAYSAPAQLPRTRSEAVTAIQPKNAAASVQRVGSVVGLRGAQTAPTTTSTVAKSTPKNDSNAKAASQQVAAAQEGQPPAPTGLINGAVAPVPAASFDSRWGAAR